MGPEKTRRVCSKAESIAACPAKRTKNVLKYLRCVEYVDYMDEKALKNTVYK